MAGRRAAIWRGAVALSTAAALASSSGCYYHYDIGVNSIPELATGRETLDRDGDGIALGDASSVEVIPEYGQRFLVAEGGNVRAVSPAEAAQYKARGAREPRTEFDSPITLRVEGKTMILGDSHAIGLFPLAGTRGLEVAEYSHALTCALVCSVVGGTVLAVVAMSVALSNFKLNLF